MHSLHNPALRGMTCLRVKRAKVEQCRVFRALQGLSQNHIEKHIRFDGVTGFFEVLCFLGFRG